MSDRDRGILHKYDVRRVLDPFGKHEGCRYFVMDPQHDHIARAALIAYAETAEAEGYEQLAGDLRRWVAGCERESSAVLRQPVNSESA